MAYKLGECLSALLYLYLLTLVQFLHGITAVHKTDDEDTLDSKKRANLCSSSPSTRRKTAGNFAYAEYVVEFMGSVS